MNRSPLAPTYSGSAEVDITFSVDTVLVHELPSSLSLDIFTPKPTSNLFSTSVMTINPIPLPRVVLLPQWLTNSRLLSVTTVFPLYEYFDLTVPVVHWALEAVPGGSRRIICSNVGPSVTKLLPVGRNPRMMPSCMLVPSPAGSHI